MPKRVFRREAIRLQSLPIKFFMGKCYVDDPLPNIAYAAIWMPTFIVWPYLTLGNTFGLCGAIRTIFFYLVHMCPPPYTLSRKTVKLNPPGLRTTELFIIFLICMQSEKFVILIYTLESKLCLLEYSICLYRKHCICTRVC